MSWLVGLLIALYRWFVHGERPTLSAYAADPTEDRGDTDVSGW